MDSVILKDIEFRGHHGDSPEERHVGGRFQVDVAMQCDVRRAEETDSLEDTVDYFSVHKRVLEIGTTDRCQMLESLAGRIARMILTEFEVAEVKVGVRKILPPLEGIVGWSGVEITRRRGDY
jgi:7,8-dihydroneopterin aldolase/epimerase/oxygenase